LARGEFTGKEDEGGGGGLGEGGLEWGKEVGMKIEDEGDMWGGEKKI
jgi:hypothetical protein